MPKKITIDVGDPENEYEFRDAEYETDAKWVRVTSKDGTLTLFNAWKVISVQVVP